MCLNMLSRSEGPLSLFSYPLKVAETGGFILTPYMVEGWELLASVASPIIECRVY